MKQTIRLTESELRNIISEAVKEISLKTAKNAHSKMINNHQFDRANSLEKTYNDVYGDDYGKYRFNTDDEPVGVVTSIGDKKYEYNPGRFSVFATDDVGGVYDDDEFTPFPLCHGEEEEYSKDLDRWDDIMRSNDRKRANSLAKKFNDVYSLDDPNKGKPFKKGDFISETVNRVLRKYIH